MKCLLHLRLPGSFIASAGLILLNILIRPTFAAPELAPVPLFQRCYTHFTGKRAPSDHSVLLKVKNAGADPIRSCLALLTATELIDTTGRLESPPAGISSDDTLKILRNFYNFHRSWFEVTNFNTAPASDNDGWQWRFLDETEAPLLVTRTLFESNSSYSEVVHSNYSVRGLRTDGSESYDPSFPNSIWGKRERGDLIGIYRYPDAENGFFHGDRGTLFKDLFKFYNNPTPFGTTKTYGAGVLGLQPFMIMNSGFPSSADRANGGERLQRRWAKNSLQLLCRTIPVLRTSDVVPIVAKYNALNTDPSKSSPFRQAASCMTCHATIDPMAALTRNIIFFKATYEDLNEKGETPGGGFQNSGERGERYGDWGHFSYSHTPNMPPDVSVRPENIETSLVTKDPNFYNRPPHGVIRFRSYNGNLIEKFVDKTNNTAESMNFLGETFAESEDLYVCAAKRYFQYFTGINADLSDQGDPNSLPLSADQKHYRDIVVSLGLKLKQHKNLKLLITDIVELPLYKKRSMSDD